ncbi:zinc knuckle domain-containing protein [Cystoisospora suis]|uniref:Zinc knuckle domain-containing protein n=1 Tax=Cystoisospora suis TaxID=483139 RepID=A0A2C6KZU4_9APIC|nr:zinc knuckle domain-containing protein [Cystoisospora suis]
MPASVSRVPMPESNRVSVSSTLRTNAIWKDLVKYDPYAPATNGKDIGCSGTRVEALQAKARELFALARMTGSIAARIPGACRKCNEVGHFAYQCKNMIRIADSPKESTGRAWEKVVNEEDEKKLCEELGIAQVEDGADDSTSTSAGDSPSPSKSGRRTSQSSPGHMFWYDPRALPPSRRTRSKEKKRGRPDDCDCKAQRKRHKQHHKRRHHRH